MITAIYLDNLMGTNQGISITSNTSGFTVRNIEGLGPVKASIVTSEYSLLDGGQYQSSKRDMRNVLITIGLSTNIPASPPNVLRAALYKVAMPKTMINFAITFDNLPTVLTRAYVESFETSLFTKDPSVTISLICPDPDFRDFNVTTVNGNSTVSPTNTQYTLTNTGNVPSGYNLEVNLNQSISDFQFRLISTTGATETLYVTTPLISGDKVVISTELNNKYARLTRSGVTSSILYAVSTASVWALVKPGTSYARLTGPAGSTAFPFILKWTPRYGGF